GIASSWIDFGDGTSVNATTATHTYNTPGTYTVLATVYNGVGKASRTSTTVSAATNQPPNGFVDQAISASNGSKTVPQGGNLYVSGWAAATQTGATIAQVQIMVDGTVVGNANVSSVNSGWDFTYNIGNLAVGSHVAGAIARDSQGNVA